MVIVSPFPPKRLMKWIFLIFLLFISLSAYYYVHSPNSTNSAPSILHHQTDTAAIEEAMQNPHKKIILFWTSFFGTVNFNVGTGSKPFQSCPLNECLTTYDRSLLHKSDAVIFHIRDFNFKDLPPHRQPHQRWIFYSLEPPHLTPLFLDKLSDFFNWTMTYRTDSDVFSPYGVTESTEALAKTSENQMDIVRNLVHRKRKQVAWFVSNCRPASKRKIYADELGKHIKVDVFGKCGTQECRDSLQCYKMMERDYKFYLSFENSVCVDYVTEKFYNAFLFTTVPIVFGGANYSQLAPNMSYINIRDYGSAAELAKYLNHLDSNDEEYLRYFEWRRNSPGIETHLPHITNKPWCSLCEMLHNKSLPNRSYHNIQSWWFDGGKCGKDERSIFERILSYIFLKTLEW